MFGLSVVIAGDRVLTGAPRDSDAGPSRGAVYAFGRSKSGWSQLAKLTASDAAAGDSFGQDVAALGRRAVIGAWGVDDGGSASGAAYSLGVP